MARSIWKGAIQFGLVTIPVKLYTATDSKATVRFNLLHAKDLARINMKVWCPEDEKIIPRTETVRGYEWAPDQYVVIEEADLENVPLATVRSIEIHQFVPRDGQGDRATRFVKQAYYIEPDPIGRKAFALLKSVLADKDLTAICKIALRDREHLAALDPFGRTMLLTTIHWPDEIKSLAELDLPEEEPEFRAAERAMAEQLVAAMTEEFDPTQYRDEYKEAVMRVIEAKVEGKEVEAPAQPQAGSLVDLMAALQASVEATRKARDDGARPVSVTAARAKAKSASAARSGGSRGKDEAADERAAPSRAAATSARKPAKRAADEEAEEMARPAARRRKSA
ncbi:MAG: Ku protein [Chloroflexi bacterium]|nr:Ku protein [Chloroflexota bacterium]